MRALSVSIGDILLVNLYAPTLRPEREAFFTSLLSWNLDPINTVIAGDFTVYIVLFSIVLDITAPTGRKILL